MEELLHYVWKHKLFPLEPLRTTAGEPVEVIDAGLANPHAGPDFFNAKIRLGGTLWVGNVEIHTRATDWARHGHHRDAAYDNVVLHVVGTDDGPATYTNGRHVPQLQLTCPDHVVAHYRELRRADTDPPCHAILPTLSTLTVHAWLTALQAERLGQRADAITARVGRCDSQWEDAFFVTLARNFGFGVNGDAFEAWAYKLPFRAVDKHRDNLLQVEAFFFGQAGLLEAAPAEGDDYYARLHGEYRYLCRKFTLPAPLEPARWRFLRLRPANFPHVRLAQLAYLYHTRPSLLSQVVEADSAAAAEQLFRTATSDYWTTHFTFTHPSPPQTKRPGPSALRLLLINTVVPTLYAYGAYRSAPQLCRRAAAFLEALPPEANHIVRAWAAAGISAATAADSQALLQLRHAYCDRKDCLRCRFGYEYLRSR
jgi:hypothetical protein